MRRNDTLYPHHQQAYADYDDMMTLTEELISSICSDIHGE